MPARKYKNLYSQAFEQSMEMGNNNHIMNIGGMNDNRQQTTQHIH